MTIKITNISKVKSDIAKQVMKKVIPTIQSDVYRATTEQIKPIISKYFIQDEVIQGIAGHFPGDEDKDLQAIFGLDDATAMHFLESIQNIITSNLEISYNKSEPRGKKFTFKISINEDDFLQQIQELESAAYEYDFVEIAFYGGRRGRIVNKARIPWFDWFMRGVTVDADLEFDIDYNEVIRTRSGRAIMIERGKSSWSWAGDSDWLTRILTNKFFLEECEEILRDNVVDQLEKVNVTIL